MFAGFVQHVASLLALRTQRSLGCYMPFFVSLPLEYTSFFISFPVLPK